MTPPYTTARPIPAGDGGPMLWPVATTVRMLDGSYPTESTRYGLVDASGTLVVRPRYESYEYCRDPDGRVVLLIGTSADRKAELLDLTGRVVARAPTRSATCGPSGQVIFQRWTGAELGIHRDGVLDVATGRILVPMVKGRHVALVDGTTVNVSEPAGEYFLDAGTGRRTPHPGRLVAREVADGGGPGLPAAATGDEDSPIGYLGRDGRWVVWPQFVHAGGFSGGHAVVQLDARRSTFLDEQFRRVGGEWTGIATLSSADGTTVGYQVSSDAGGGLLGPDLGALVEPGSGQVGCLGDLGGACAIEAADGRVSLVVPPDSAVRPLPDGYRHVVGPSFVADAVGRDQRTWHVLALGSGAVASLDWPSRCEAVDDAWAVCSPSLPGSNDDEWEPDILPAVVIDDQGRRTGLVSVTPTEDPVHAGSAPYYLAATGRYTGLVDRNGTWLYRQSLFTELED